MGPLKKSPPPLGSGLTGPGAHFGDKCLCLASGKDRVGSDPSRQPMILLSLLILVQAPVPEARRLNATDRAVSRTSGAVGLAAALDTILAEDAVLLYPGAPITRGRAAILRVLRHQPPAATRVQWDAVFTELSADSTLAVSYGSTFPRTADSVVAGGRFESAWRRTPGGWKVAALGLFGVPAAAGFTADAADSQASGELPADTRNPYARADAAFSDRAGASGASDAFAAFGDVDAALVGAGGAPMTRSPSLKRIMAGNGADRSKWRWWPVVAVGDSAAGVGFTAGQAEIRDLTTGEVTYSEYLTLWRAGPRGIRFLADGGNPWPRELSKRSK